MVYSYLEREKEKKNHFFLFETLKYALMPGGMGNDMKISMERVMEHRHGYVGYEW